MSQILNTTNLQNFEIKFEYFENRKLNEKSIKIS